MAQDSFKFYKADSVYGNLFFQFPKVLMYGSQYSKLSSDTKLAYMVLKDRLEYSLKNHLVDEENHVYFIFTNEELKSLFNCSNTKVAKIKKELETAHLLLQKRMGFQPSAGRQLPNRLYLADLSVNPQDRYLRSQETSETAQTLDKSRLPKIRSQHETAQSLGNKRLPKIRSQYEFATNMSQTLDKSRLPKIGHDLYKDLDINTRDNKETEKLDFSTNRYAPEIIKKQNQDLVKNARNYLPESTTGGLFLNKEGVELLSLWCQSPKQMHRFLGIILNAKKAVEREHEGTTIVLDDPQCQEMINKTMRRFFNILRSDSKKINNVENYLFGAMKETLVAYWNKSLMTANGGDPNEF
ncbi:putative plasmid replication initiation protein [Lacticaseibacillus paracasei]|uniref:replication initiator protein A n=1 Tax=Lacticaseibacillus paracasei TaxID=1597 RepID=UPI0002973971|nr:replication initiator protein A [Lacticaseibacillus paracasei]EKQ24642.1 putative plasmid replication initiation protein [Lacticaseibacillus paracasei]POO14141.1 41 kDa protein [Lacticaseibacillus paracasei]